jgi:hypothetical protein
VLNVRFRNYKRYRFISKIQAVVGVPEGRCPYFGAILEGRRHVPKTESSSCSVIRLQMTLQYAGLQHKPVGLSRDTFLQSSNALYW